MKKVVIALVAVCLMFSAVGCGGEAPWGEDFVPEKPEPLYAASEVLPASHEDKNLKVEENSVSGEPVFYTLLGTDEGILPDDTQGDSQAINAALGKLNQEHGGGTLYLPAGMYLLDEPIVMQKNTAIEGDWAAPDASGVPADGTLLVMEGWAEAETSDRVDALLEEYPNVLYIKSDPTPDDEPPVKLRNNRFARIFELVGDMYARPKYGTLDLTPFFAPFYMLFFGICLNDAGYGLILLAMGVTMLLKFKEGTMHRAAWFATMCAVSTIAVGLFCGSFFGIPLKEYFPSVPFFDFQGKFFSWALAIGIVQILFGLLLRVLTITATVGFRYALSTLGWFVILLGGSLAAGLPMLDEAWVIPGFTASSPAFYAVLGAGAVLMFFFNSPGKNPFINFGTGLWDTYNNITGILSDVLSYIRLFAIGLSGGILATVFNDLASGLSPDIPVLHELVVVIILLIGHSINIFMSAISSFVHPMRLTFVEFYKNAGFEMAARQFEPLTKLDQTENK